MTGPVTTPTARPDAPPRRRHLVAALHVARAGVRTRLVTIAGIVLAIVVVSAAIRVLSTSSDDGRGNIGLYIAVYISAFTAYIQAMTQAFGFALGLGITRRHYTGAVALLILAESLLTGVVLTALLLAERATGGWGIGLRAFDVAAVEAGGPVVQVLALAGPFAALAVLGALVGAVFKRWGQVGVWTLSIGTGALAALVVLLVTWLQAWPAVNGAVSAAWSGPAAWVLPFLPAVAIGAGAYAVARRATP